MDLKCERCGHEWFTRTDKKPKVCPSCKSLSWMKPMTEYWRKMKEKREAEKVAK